MLSPAARSPIEMPTPKPILSDTESPDPEPDCEEVVGEVVAPM